MGNKMLKLQRPSFKVLVCSDCLELEKLLHKPAAGDNQMKKFTCI